MMYDLRYIYHLTKSLIHGVINWINKTKERPVKFFFYMTCKQPFLFAKMSLQRLTCHTARHPKKRLKEKCLKKEMFLKLLIEKFCSGCYITDITFLKIVCNFTLQHSVSFYS